MPLFLPADEQVRTIPASCANCTLPADVGMVDLTITADATINPPAARPGASVMVMLTQGGLGGWTVTWNSAIRWADDTPPVLTVPAGAQDVITLVCVDGEHWLGFSAGQDMS